jgi:hypothetical protein
MRSADRIELRLSLEAKRKTSTRDEYFAFRPIRDIRASSFGRDKPHRSKHDHPPAAYVSITPRDPGKYQAELLLRVIKLGLCVSRGLPNWSSFLLCRRAHMIRPLAENGDNRWQVVGATSGYELLLLLLHTANPPRYHSGRVIRFGLRAVSSRLERAIFQICILKIYRENPSRVVEGIELNAVLMFPNAIALACVPAGEPN